MKYLNHCIIYEESISAYVDDELNASDKMLLEAHFKACPGCSNLLVLYREMSASMAETDVQTPPFLSRSVMDMIKNSNYDRHRDFVTHEKSTMVTRILKSKKHFPRYATIAACLAIVLLLLPQFLNIDRSGDVDNLAEPNIAPMVRFGLNDEMMTDDMMTEEMMIAGDFDTGGGAIPDTASGTSPAPAPAPGALPQGQTPIAVDDDSNNIRAIMPDTERFAIQLDKITEDYFAYIEIDHDPPDTLFRIAYQNNSFLIKRADVTELILDLEEFILLYLPGNEHADFAIVLFTN